MLTILRASLRSLPLDTAQRGMTQGLGPWLPPGSIWKAGPQALREGLQLFHPLLRVTWPSLSLMCPITQ